MAPALEFGARSTIVRFFTVRDICIAAEKQVSPTVKCSLAPLQATGLRAFQRINGIDR
jgi:hypothetical protein